MAEQWVLVRPDAAVADAVGLPRAELPVRADRAERLFDGARVDLCGVIDELEYFAGQQPDQIPRLEPSVIRLATTAIDELLVSHNWELAEIYALRALRWAPKHPTLRVQLGRAQHGLGRHAEATVHWLAVVADARGRDTWSPMLWLMTARSLMEQEQWAAAATLLEDIADHAPDDPQFWQLHRHVQERLVDG